MGRRGNGEGTITHRKDGRWEARYYVPTVSGTKRKTIYGKTQTEVRDRLTKALSDRIDGIVYDDENLAFGEYLDIWLKGSVYGSVRQSLSPGGSGCSWRRVRRPRAGLPRRAYT